MDAKPKIGGKADKGYSKKMGRLSDYCFAPRYVKFFTCPFFDENDKELDPYAEIEAEMAAWINESLAKSLGHDMLQVLPSVTKDEVVVMALYRTFELY